ncbi:hypothetical protein D3C81_1367050 [compost metagenome]
MLPSRRIARGMLTKARSPPAATCSPSRTSSQDSSPVVGANTVIKPCTGTSCPLTVERRV